MAYYVVFLTPCRIVEGEIMKRRYIDEPTAVSSKLGWILCGLFEGQQQVTTTAMFSTVDAEEATTRS